MRGSSPAAVLGIATGVTLVALFENTVLPWAPFHVAHAALATIVPLALGTYAFGKLGAISKGTWGLAILSPILLTLFGGIWFGVLGTSPDPALERVFVLSGERLGVEPSTLRSAYLLFVFGWAGVGEELFYRGYVHAALRRSGGPARAAIVSAALFGVRHALQLAMLWPGYPWGPSLAWVGFAFVAGLVMSYLYEKSGSLYPPVLAHYLLNLAPTAAFFLAG